MSLPMRRRTLAALLVAALTSYVLAVACQDATGPNPSTDVLSLGTVSGPLFVGAGDIASCATAYKDEGTALMVLAQPSTATVFTLGDNAYPDGTTANYGCYNASWGAFKARTRPAPGNHDYHYNEAAAYYAYFGSLAGPAGKGYYSYTLGTWHILSLNSERSVSTQTAWIKADLAAHPAHCTLAYWHKPLFTVGHHSPWSPGKDWWSALYAAHADVVLNGHDHNYQRFKPQKPDGTADATNGIVEFVSGTGGSGLYDFEHLTSNKNLAAKGKYWGILRLTLGTGAYHWEFRRLAGSALVDSGTTACH